MPDFQLPFGDNSGAIWQQAALAGVQPSPPPARLVDGYRYFGMILITSGPQQIGNPLSAIILLSPKLSNDDLAKMIVVAKPFGVPCGFDPADAFFYKKVIFVGPWDPNELANLAAGGATLTEAKSKTALIKALKAL